VLLGLLLGSKEDTVTCKDFLRDLKARGSIRCSRSPMARRG
jgi:hypothetical protein